MSFESFVIKIDVFNLYLEDTYHQELGNRRNKTAFETLN